MRTDLVIVGTGGQGREILDIVRAVVADGADLNAVGFVDDAPSRKNQERVEGQDLPVLGDVEWLVASMPRVQVVIGVGSGSARRSIDHRLASVGFDSPVLVHPTASIGSATKLGSGSCLWAGARLTTNIRAGRHVHINQNATVGHDSVLGDYVTLNPLSAVSGDVSLGEASLIGAGAVILQGRHVGAGSRIGASACVVDDVRRDTTVVGIPARQVGS